MNSKDDPLIVAVPSMHPGLFPGGPDEWFLFFDPGLGQPSGEAGYYLSSGLPMDRVRSQSYLNQMEDFGRQFKSSRDLGSLAAARGGDEPGGGATLKSEMAALDAFEKSGGALAEEKTSAPDQNDLLTEKRAKAQMYLILAWSLEEKVLELQGAESGLGRIWSDFGRVLGVEGDERDMDPFQLARVSPQAGEGEQNPPDWRNVLKCMSLFLPDQAALLFRDPRIVEELKEKGVVFSPLEPGRGGLESLPPDTAGGMLEAEAGPEIGLDRSFRLLFQPV